MYLRDYLNYIFIAYNNNIFGMHLCFLWYTVLALSIIFKDRKYNFKLRLFANELYICNPRTEQENIIIIFQFRLATCYHISKLCE